MSCEAISLGKATFLIINAQARGGSNTTNSFEVLKPHAPCTNEYCLSRLTEPLELSKVTHSTQSAPVNSALLLFTSGKGTYPSPAQACPSFYLPTMSWQLNQGREKSPPGTSQRLGSLREKEKGKSVLSQAVLFTSHDLSLPLRVNIIFRTCPVNGCRIHS